MRFLRACAIALQGRAEKDADLASRLVVSAAGAWSVRKSGRTNRGTGRRPPKYSDHSKAEEGEH